MRTPQQAMKEAIESGAVQAWIEGKGIQFKGHGDWFDFSQTVPAFCHEVLQWRPAPTSKLRPWRPEDVPVGALVRTLRTGAPFRWMIVASCSDGVTTCGGTTCRTESAQFMFDACEHSTDGGKTWKPCGVMEGGE